MLLQCGSYTAFMSLNVCLCCLCAGASGEGEVPLEWNSGSNGYVYWVSNYLGGPLTQLPHVTPAQVRMGSLSCFFFFCLLGSPMQQALPGHIALRVKRIFIIEWSTHARTEPKLLSVNDSTGYSPSQLGVLLSARADQGGAQLEAAVDRPPEQPSQQLPSVPWQRGKLPASTGGGSSKRIEQ
jgi:hypothetical protein